jgi:hypothetical protein
MAEGLQSPGEGWRYLRFSDGEGAWISPRATDAQWAQIKAQGEAERDQKYMAQAAQQNSPVVTQSKVYSATMARPNDIHGRLAAWMDHNLGFNAVNRSPAWQAAAPYVGPATGAISRVGTAAIERNPYVAATDLGLTGINIGKHLLAKEYPGANAVPDLPTILSQVRSAAGTPELDPNASASQRVLENAASVSLNPSQWSRSALLDAVGRSGMSYAGGEAGEELGGEAGQAAGSFVGGAPGSGKALLQRAVAPLFRGKNTMAVSAAADRQGIQPSLGSVSNAMGRLFTKAAAAVPGVGSAVRSAQDRFNDAIRQRQQEIGEDVFGGPLPPSISDEDIGQALLNAARQGSADITQRASNEQEQLIHGQPARPATGATPAQPAQPGIGHNTGVNARGVYRGPAGYEQARLTMDPGTYPAYAARLDNIRQAAVEAQLPFFQNFWGQLNAGEVPYQRFQILRNNIGQDIPGFAGMTKGQQDQLYEAMTNAMRDAAFTKGGQALADRFDAANENYKSLIGSGGKRDQLVAIGGKPQAGGWEQFFGPQGQTQPAVGVDFTGGKGQGEAATWLTSKMRSPDKIAPFADPTIVPNDLWRQVVGMWLATRGQTAEGTFRPDQMARELGGEDTKTNKGVGTDVQTQLFAGPQGAPTANARDVNDIATLGRNAVVPINRSGLTDTAGTVFALKKLSDWISQGVGVPGGLLTMALAGRNLSDPEFVNAVRGQGTPLVDSLYAGIPAATQNILQYQNNPPAAYDPLGWSVTSGQASSQ